MSRAREPHRSATFFGLVASLLAVGLCGPLPAAEPRGADRITFEPVLRGRLETCCATPAQPDPSLDGGRRVVRQGDLVDPEDLAALQALTAGSPDVPAGTELGAPGRAPAPGSLAPDLLERFAGVDILTDTTAGLSIPPDSQIAVGPGVYLQATNTALLLAARSGTNPRTVNLNEFFSEPFQFSVFDPKLFYDRFSRRFFLVSLGRSEQPQQSFLYLAVSRSETPGGFGDEDWCRYRINARREGSWADYPGLGVNERWVGVSVNQFGFDDTYDTAYVYAMTKASLVANGPACPSFPGYSLFAAEGDPGGSLVFTMQPAQHLSRNNLPGAPLFFVNTRFAATNVYTVWRLTGTGLDDAQVTGELVSTVESYDFPPRAPQAGGGEDLETGDVRVTHAVFRAGRLWAVHASGCVIGLAPNESCIRAVEFAPGVLSTTVASEQTFGNAGWYYFWPGVSVNLAGDVVVAFERARADRFLDVAYNGRPAGAERFDPARALQLGQCPLDDVDGSGRNRTGDFIGIQTDPGDNRTFWIAGEYAAEQGVIGCSWSTAIGHVEYSVPAPPPGAGESMLLVPSMPEAGAPAPGEAEASDLELVPRGGRLQDAPRPRIR